MMKSISGIEDVRVRPRLNNAINVAAMDTDSDTHEHMLWSLSNASVDPQEVRSLERLEPKAIRTTYQDSAVSRSHHEKHNPQIVMEVPLIDDAGVKQLGVVHHALIRLLGDHTCRFAILGIDIVVQVLYNLRE